MTARDGRATARDDGSPTVSRGGRAPRTVTLARAVVDKQLILLRRYWVNTAMLLVGMYGLFAMFFYGSRAVGGAGIGDTLNGLVVGFFLLTAATAAYFDVAGNVMREAQWGTLEQLFMSPYGIGRVMAVKSAFNVTFSSVIGLVLLGIMLLTTDRALTVDVLTVVPLLVVTILSAVGIGFAFAGLSLLYKRIENVSQLMQFAFIALVAAPARVDGWVLAALPLSHGSGLLTLAMTEGVRLWEFPVADLLLLFGNGLAYLAAGYAVFHLFVRRARRLGVMGHY